MRIVIIILFVFIYLINIDGIFFSKKNASPLIFTRDLSVRFLHFNPLLKNPELFAYWALDEGSGFECEDWSGNELNAFITGHYWNTTNSGLTSSFRKNGKREGCIYLNGNQWLQVQTTPTLNIQESFSIFLWIKPDELKDSEIINKSQDDKGFLMIMDEEGSLSFIYSESDKTFQSIKSPSGCIKSGIWQQIGVTFNEEKRKICLFYNNQILVQQSLKPSSKIEHSFSDLTIGGSQQSIIGFKGSIDEISFFKTAIDIDKIEFLYIVGMPKTYLQTKETIDDKLTCWNNYHGNSPIPHTIDKKAIMILRFNNNIVSLQSHQPLERVKTEFLPGVFGGALDMSNSDIGICYKSPINTKCGTFEAWIQIIENKAGEVPLFQLEGRKESIELKISNDLIRIFINHTGFSTDLLEVKDIGIEYEELQHIALTWNNYKNSTLFHLFLNGVEIASKQVYGIYMFNKKFWIGGNNRENFYGLLDDVCLSNKEKKWGEICPRGIIDTESSAIDLMLGFDYLPDGPLMHWYSSGGSKNWKYAIKSWDSSEDAKCIIQSEISGTKVLYHPDAYGFNSSFEATIAVDTIQNGWIGIFVQSPNQSENSFSGHTFTINYHKQKICLSTFKSGEIIQKKILDNDFQLHPKRIYLLTLSSVNGKLQGFIDNRNVISLINHTQTNKGFAGLITMDGKAYFDDIHFTSITQPVKKSRMIMINIINENRNISYSELSLNAFRWEKRYGLLPWERNYKNPEPPGNIFGPNERTERPNPTSKWRSEDAANSELILINGTFYYFMRGNPDINGKHGSSKIGVLWCEDNTFDGIHFFDPSLSENPSGKIWALEGHKDSNKGGCNDEPPRNNRFQLNGQSCVYFDGQILLLCRESRNPNKKSEKFMRLVMGIFDIKTRSWISKEPNLLKWSSMNPDSCYSKMQGINATPEITLVRDPITDEFIVLLFHHTTRSFKAKNSKIISKGTSSISGFDFDGYTLNPNPQYNENLVISKNEDVWIYGERVLFDNGIWYLNINAHQSGLIKDWPDRFELFTTLDPYKGPWIESYDNSSQRSYFLRGGEFDPDNGAIWQGEMLEYRNHYYMYYENYHSIDNVEVMYEYYDHPQSGSRVGFAVAN